MSTTKGDSDTAKEMADSHLVHSVIDTEYCADTVEWCPYKNDENLLLCGTYELLKDLPEEEGARQNRTGRILLFNRNDTELEEVDRTETAAVLDIKWAPSQLHNKKIFVACDSLGFTTLYSVQESETGKQKIVQESRDTFVVDENDLNVSEPLALAADISESGNVVCSGNDGTIAVWSIQNDGSLGGRKTWKGHSSRYTPYAEAWTCSFDTWNKNLLFTGGDEAKLKGWDLRQDTTRPTFMINEHSGGVCSVQNNRLCEDYFATGSYDDRVCVWDRRNLKDPLSKTNVGGGVWRIKWHPTKKEIFSVACVYDGFKVLSIDNWKDVSTICHYNGPHDSLAYGIDWCRMEDPSKEFDTNKLAACSFYDHTLSFWSCPI